MMIKARDEEVHKPEIVHSHLVLPSWRDEPPDHTDRSANQTNEHDVEECHCVSEVIVVALKCERR
jgi:hypothetical protein